MIGTNRISLKKQFLLSLIFIVLLVFFASITYGLKAENYTFDEPENIFWLVNQHMATTYSCPEERTYSAIETQIAKQNPLMISKMTSDKLTEFKNKCNVSNFYTVEPFGPEKEISTCFQHLDKLARDNAMYERNGLIYSNVRWVYRECYIRQYFEQRFNKNTVEDYNQTDVDKIYEQRDSELLDFLNYTIEYPEGTGPGKIISDNGTIIPPRIEISRASEEEMKAHPEKYESNPTITETVNIPSKSMIQVIKEKIRAFFDWFK